MKCGLFTGILCLLAFSPISANASEPLSKQQALESLRRAVEFFRTQVSVQGGYLWRYSHDLELREGEGAASKTTAWVQPPGTPSVGEAFLMAYETTGDEVYLEAAVETASALVNGQLESGGWDYRIEYGSGRDKYAYRSAGTSGRNVTTLDDNTTQAALQFLMHVDQATGMMHASVHECVEYALTHLIAAQFPNGAWPQRFSAPPAASEFPVLRASYPESWPRRHPDVDYRSFYTFNDNTLADMITTMFEAERIYQQPRYAAAACRAGDFILLAQMPEPQPAWAQQYDATMHPAWARRFEPASVTGGESQGVLRILLELYRQTEDEKYLAPIPKALAYLNRSRLPDGRLARFYELKTNRPLYFTMDYRLTYNDDDLPTHYSFKVGSQLPAIEEEYNRLLNSKRDEVPPPRRPRLTTALSEQVAQIVEQQADSGAWMTAGVLRNYENQTSQEVIESRQFIANVRSLCEYIAALDAAR